MMASYSRKRKYGGGYSASAKRGRYRVRRRLHVRRGRRRGGGGGVFRRFARKRQLFRTKKIEVSSSVPS